jgi:hypothetical protein
MKDLPMKDLNGNPSLKAIHGEFAIHVLQSAANTDVCPPPGNIYVLHHMDNKSLRRIKSWYQKKDDLDQDVYGQVVIERWDSEFKIMTAQRGALAKGGNDGYHEWTEPVIL